MKKYAFLIPVAVAVGALVAPTAAKANKPFSGVSDCPLSESTTPRAVDKLKVKTSPTRVDSFVLSRSERGILLAQHESHESHQSHESHASHSSHESHESHASHTSSAG
jgi:hypothetical protein